MYVKSEERWTFSLPTPLGDTRSTFEIDDAALRFESDEVFDPGAQTIPWPEVREAGTATMTVMGGGRGPDLARWVPGQIEWLVLARRGGAPGLSTAPCHCCRPTATRSLPPCASAR